MPPFSKALQQKCVCLHSVVWPVSHSLEPELPLTTSTGSETARSLISSNRSLIRAFLFYVFQNLRLSYRYAVEMSAVCQLLSWHNDVVKSNPSMNGQALLRHKCKHVINKTLLLFVRRISRHRYIWWIDEYLLVFRMYTFTAHFVLAKCCRNKYNMDAIHWDHKYLCWKRKLHARDPLTAVTAVTAVLAPRPSDGGCRRVVR